MIEAKRAGLVLESVAVLESKMLSLGAFGKGIVEMIPDEKTEMEVDFRQHNNDENKKMVIMSVVVQSGKSQGYHIEMDIICQFNCENSDEVNDYYTMLCISVSKLREAIMQLTLFGVHGIYTMPLIDCYDLFNRVVKEMKDVDPLPEKEGEEV